MTKNLDIEPCIDPAYARNPHLQTILGYMTPAPKAPSTYQKWKIELADGDAMLARYYEGKSDTVVVVFHGLAGNADSSYMQSTAVISLELGHSVLLVNHRGAGEGAKLAKKFYSSNSAEDMSAVIRMIQKKKPQRKILAAGFSLSANVILNLLGGQSGSDKPDQAIVVNPPVDLVKTSAEFRRGLNNIYDQHFVKLIKSELKTRKKDGSDVPPFPMVCRLSDIDDIFTAPNAGFKSKEEYYDKCSSKHVVHKIDVPTLILMAENDPFIPIDSFHNLKYPKSVRVHIEKTGGHMGYLTTQKTPRGSRRWLDYFMHEAIKSMT